MAEDLPQEGWYRDPVDPSRRRWWDGHEWSTIVAPPVTAPALPAVPVPARPTMADGTMLPYASESSVREEEVVDPASSVDGDGDEPSTRTSRVRVLQMLVALVAILATAAIVYVGKGDDAQGPVDVPITTAPASSGSVDTTTSTTTTTEPTTTSEASTSTEPTTTTEPAVDEPPADTEAVEAPSYRDAYDACQVILDGSSIGSGGMDYETFRDIDADADETVTELRFEATDASGDTEAYLCRTLLDGNGDVMVGRLYLDLQNVVG